MIELTALREQLKLLGHNLPEDQIVSILKEMNIDYEDTGAQASGVSTAAESRVPYKESVDFEAKQTAQPADLSFRFGLGQPPSKLFEGGNTRMTEEDRAVQGMQALKLSGSHTQPHSTAWSGSGEQGRTAQGVPSTSAQARMRTINESGARPTAFNSLGPQQQRDSNAASDKSLLGRWLNQSQRGYGDGDSDHDPNESDLLPEPDIDPRYDPLLRYDRMDPPRTVNHNPPYTNAVQQMVQARQGRPSEGAGRGGGGHRPASAAAHTSSGGGGRPSWQGGLRDTSPTGRSTLSAQVSTASLRSNMSSASSKPGAKVDRVARYHQLQAGWSKDSFLTTSSTGHRSTNRKPINFHAHFASLHQAEAADSARRQREVRTKTKADLAPGAAYVAPTSKRRDALRWDVRMRLREQGAD